MRYLCNREVSRVRLSPPGREPRGDSAGGGPAPGAPFPAAVAEAFRVGAPRSQAEYCRRGLGRGCARVLAVLAQAVPTGVDERGVRGRPVRRNPSIPSGSVKAGGDFNEAGKGFVLAAPLSLLLWRDSWGWLRWGELE